MNKKVYVNLSQQDVQDIINGYEKDIEKFNKQKEVIDKIKEILKSKQNGICYKNGKEKQAYTFVLNFDEAREFIWKIEELLEEIE